MLSPQQLELARTIAMGVLACGSVITAIFAIRGFQQARRTHRMTSFLEIKRATVASNAIVLSSKENLKIGNRLLYGKGDDEEAIERWIAFGILNAAETAFLTAKFGPIDAPYQQIVLRHHVERLLFPVNDGNTPKRVYEALHYGGYDQRFIEYCEEECDSFKQWRLAEKEREKAPKRKP